MPLTKPPLPTVEPGRPITAQGWNGIVDGLSALYDEVLAFGRGQLAVSVQSDGQPVANATVVAEPVTGDGSPVDAIPLHGTQVNYLLTGVSEGNWRVFVSAPGFTAQTVETTVPRNDPLVVNLATAGVVVPDLFGLGLQAAVAAMTTAGVDVDLMVDTLGHEISKIAIPAESQNSPVLAQLPPTGAVIDPSTTRMRLVVAAAIVEQPVVTMPSLIGLTQAEAARALEQIGLRLGSMSVRS